MKNYYQPLPKTRGATLVIALIMLLLLTLLGTSAIKTTVYQERMASNLNDGEVAFQSSESALCDAETQVLGVAAEPIPSNTCSEIPCVKELDTSINFAFQPFSWWTSNGTIYSGNLASASQPPYHYVEFLRFVPDSPAIGQGQASGLHFYRITARGTGQTTVSKAVLQSTLARRY